MNVRRPVAAVVLSLGLLTASACGSDSGRGIDAVSIPAETGKAPEVKFEDDFQPEELEVKVLTEGKGDATKTDDLVLAHLFVQNAADEQVKVNTYEEGEGAQEFLLEKGIMPGFEKALVGHRPGSVVAVTGPADALFPDGGYVIFGVGNKDAMVMRAEIVEIKTAEERDAYKKEQEEAEAAQAKAEEEQRKAAEAEVKEEEARVAAQEKAKASALPKAQGTPRKRAAWAPRVDFKQPVPTFDFTGTPKPDGKLQVTTLIEGRGKVLKKGDSVAVKYVGQVYGKDAPFDNNYESGELFTFTLGAEGSVDGFDMGVTGQKVGSRIIINVPPSLGYQEDRGEIKAGVDTMVFVVDIVGAA